MLRYFFFLLLYILSTVVSATPLTEDNVPDLLKPWVNWVLQDEKKFQCPFLYNNFQQKRCSWPGNLSLELNPKQAQFISHWQVYKEDWIFLPGNKKNWPQNVTVNNKPALVMNRHGKPGLKLAAGAHIIQGDFFWEQIPESIAIPYDTGLLNLKINNKVISYPMIKKGLVWLKESDIGKNKPKSVENKVGLQVFRKVYDDVPLQLVTYLELEVSGDQREISLPHALLSNFIPISLKSPLPAKIEPNGSLLVQVRPGRWHIELTARHPHLLTQLTFNVADTQWPKSEIWSFHALPFHRLVEIKNLKALDPSQTNLPRQWKSLPAYLVKQGDTMDFKVIRRGDSEPEPNQLRLKRQLWLDFNGEAYTVADTITGKMTKGWRLNALPETSVGQVKLNGQNQLVTTSIDTRKQGVEVRKGTLKLKADSRINGNISNISAVGWEQNFQQVRAELNIPPGWRLLAASGVDNDPNSWISQWTLLDLFLVLIAALAISQLWNIYWGFFALTTLAICWHEPGAPHYIWLNILAAIALIRVLPTGEFQQVLKWYRNICWFSLVVIAIPFIVSQVRIGLYPQLERQWQNISSAHYIEQEAQFEEEGDQTMKLLEKEQHMVRPASKMHREISSMTIETTQKIKKPFAPERIDPDANIQTGPGLPQWQWKKIQLSWNGSVDELQQVRFWYLSPTLSMLLNFLRVILILILSLLIFDLVNKKFTFPKSLINGILLIPLLSIPIDDVQAAFPDQTLLDELKSRLLQAPDCLPVCAQISSMNLTITSNDLSISMQVHTQQAVSIPLPAKQKQWLPNQVLVNGKPAQAIIRNANGELWLNLNSGVHTVTMQGINPVHNKFSLPLILKPHRTTISAKGWTIEGVHKNGQTDNQLILSRLKTVQQLQATSQKLDPGILPAFIRVERTLKLGLDWRIITRVIRVFNNDSALAIRFPLLNDESVTTENVRIKDKHVVVNLSSRQNSLQWESVLKKSPYIDLIAADTELWTEVWRADISPIWHLQSSGLSVVHHQDHGRWLPEWRPWPGESVRLIITRPEAVKGSTLTIDKTELQINPGKRSVENKLQILLRSSKATQHTLSLPKQAELQFVKINGQTQPIRQQGTQVTLPIKPGKQDITLVWHTLQEQSSLFTTPTVNLGISSVNNHLKLILGQDRWVLFTSGPKFGPAVLFWGVLIVIMILAIGLGKIKITPLKHWHWFLLLIGLSQISVESAMCVVIWLIALGLRATKEVTNPKYFNIVQIGLALLTFTSLLLLFVAVQQGLLGSPDMQIAGNQSSAFELNWFQDRNTELLPTATIISVPLMTYRLLMLLWSLWLAVSLLNWLKWGWSCFSSNGLWAEKKTTNSSTIISDRQ
ncbi:MAG: hypothetical protein L3J75_17500 [Methylococcaceae bacterium]|nr:hypothetical protein [Methylococcaceae bacterium]